MPGAVLISNSRLCIHKRFTAANMSTIVDRRLHQEIVDFTSYIRPTSAETVVRSTLYNALEQVIRRAVSPKALCSIELFGSSKIGLGLPGGDMDIVVITKEDHSTSKIHKKFAFRVADHLRRSGVVRAGFSDDTGEEGIQVNHFAPVPIVKCRSLSSWGNIPIDISFAQEQSSKSAGTLVASIIQTHLESQPALAPLALVLKTFLKQRGLGSAVSGGLGSYPLIVMIISFLQLNPLHLPPTSISNALDGGVRSLGRLLTDFFVYYGSLFPYEEKYISIAPAATNANHDQNMITMDPSSGFWAKPSLMEEREIIEEQTPENKTVSGSGPASEREVGGLKPRTGVTWIKNTTYGKIAIQCVVDPINDIGKATSRMKNVVAAFKEAATILLSLQNEDSADDILGQIIHLSNEATAHRAQIEQIVKEDELGRFTTNRARTVKANHVNHKKRSGQGLSPPPPVIKSRNRSNRPNGEETRENPEPKYIREATNKKVKVRKK
ncbi:MAG: hypothetical protein NXY57DRAFT_1027987 [Lentinula lateritia]|uniref:polynucleotide adenylyltransferase n=1 Tax=Lentinula lateritia TaxID=40482 RepID=A0ABQ8VWH2_9AGAR|nr:MAG: hypothetical protein NXY57DRAFT_1027987 [Lentinula lateritia]KAJ4500713.1 hypothetical protein C8R41DRAFT_808597 [Lentinula lateritia]